MLKSAISGRDWTNCRAGISGHAPNVESPFGLCPTSLRPAGWMAHSRAIAVQEKVARAWSVGTRRRNENYTAGNSRFCCGWSTRTLCRLPDSQSQPRNAMTTTSSQFEAPRTREWLTAAEAAQYLSVKVRTLLLWVRQ